MWQRFHLRLLHFLHLLLFFPGEYKNSNLLYYIKSFKKYIENEEMIVAVNAIYAIA